MRGVTTADIARGYVALVINSNYSRDLGLISADASKPELLGTYLSFGEVSQVLLGKLRVAFQRRIH